MKKVLVGGCFDVLHFGHISFLSRAREYGDWLVIALESDQNVRERKGENRPIHNQLQRQSMLLSLRSVDDVILLPPMHGSDDYLHLVQTVKPSIIAITSGDTYKKEKTAQATSVDARIVEIPFTQTPSTTQLLKLLTIEPQ